MGDREITDLEDRIHLAERTLKALRSQLEQKQKVRQENCEHEWERCHQMYESFSQCLKCGATK